MANSPTDVESASRNSSPTTHSEVKEKPPPPYSIYSKWEKWFIVGLTSFAGLFSPLTSNIYYPAIPTLTVVFHKSTELINLTVTMYIVLQGLAPMLWGTVSDHLGRRPIFMVCMLILSLSCVGLALVPTSDYWLLMLLRCLQAAGSASTIAIGAGVIGDISTAEERGGFFGIYTLGPMIGPAIGPVIGGALSGNLGWRSMFWFLCIASTICLIVMAALMPETLRIIAGNGSIQPPLVYRPFLPIIGRGRVLEKAGKLEKGARPSRNPLQVLKYVDIVLLLLINAAICANYYGVIASVSTLFHQTYPFLNETTIGLCFLGVGGGMMIGGVVSGKLLDWAFQQAKRKHSSEPGSDVSARVTAKDVTFPLEKARLGMLFYIVAFSAICCIGYGWCLRQGVNIAGPLILQILIGFCAINVMNSTQTLMVDLLPAQASTVTACNNLVRCTLSAVVVSVMDPMIAGVGVGWCYTILGGLSLSVLPLLYAEIRIGARYRGKRVKSSPT